MEKLRHCQSVTLCIQSLIFIVVARGRDDRFVAGSGYGGGAVVLVVDRLTT